MERGGVKGILVLLSLFCSVVVASILMVEVDDEQMRIIRESGEDAGFTFSKMFAYLKYYLSRLIGFLFGID